MPSGVLLIGVQAGSSAVVASTAGTKWLALINAVEVMLTSNLCFSSFQAWINPHLPLKAGPYGLVSPVNMTF